MPVLGDSIVDIACIDREGCPILVAEVKVRRASTEAADRLACYLRKLTEPVPYAMLADAEGIHLYQWDGRESS